MSYFDLENYQSKNEQMKGQIELAFQSAQMAVNMLITGPIGSGKTSLAFSLQKKIPLNQIIIFDCESNEKLPSSITENTTLLIENIDVADDYLQRDILQLILQSESHRPRLISTAKSDLKLLMKQGLFRQDLYFKIAVIQIEMLSLSDRQEDMLDIVNYIISFTEIMYMKQNISISDVALEKLKSRKWTAHIRELENVIERAVCLCQDNTINEKNIIFDDTEIKKTTENLVGMSLSEVEKRLIIQTLQLTAQNRTKAAQVLGISIRTLRNKLNEYRQEGVI